jgi:hypothetical protein
LNEPYERGYYFFASLDSRAIFKALKTDKDADNKAKDRAAQDAEALEVIRNNPRMPVRTIVSALGNRGIKRSKNWVCDRRFDLQSQPS